ncbi:hypothetical protein QYM36_007602 [Artemia franciscana]|uniref:Uncharacterized protein n=1 Tax=Artemia franciscana TaxID=6661 RepID=A0AA88LLQ8_ARTSF|nr:hypothetical protein QYM36_007602 [Artemia franciscana]
MEMQQTVCEGSVQCGVKAADKQAIATKTFEPLEPAVRHLDIKIKNAFKQSFSDLENEQKKVQGHPHWCCNA